MRSGTRSVHAPSWQRQLEPRPSASPGPPPRKRTNKQASTSRFTALTNGGLLPSIRIPSSCLLEADHQQLIKLQRHPTGRIPPQHYSQRDLLHVAIRAATRAHWSEGVHSPSPVKQECRPGHRSDATLTTRGPQAQPKSPAHLRQHLQQLLQRGCVLHNHRSGICEAGQAVLQEIGHIATQVG